MTKPIHNAGNVACMDSGFCVATGIIALHKKGVYGQSLIKKWGKYLLKHVQGYTLELAFLDSELGVAKTDAQTIEGTKFLVHCHKDAYAQSWVRMVWWLLLKTTLATGMSEENGSLLSTVSPVLPPPCKALGGWCQESRAWSYRCWGGMGNKMVATLVINIHLLDCSGQCLQCKDQR